MRMGVRRESRPGETRVAATPTSLLAMLRLGYEVVVESGAGDASWFAASPGPSPNPPPQPSKDLS